MDGSLLHGIICFFFNLAIRNSSSGYSTGTLHDVLAIYKMNISRHIQGDILDEEFIMACVICI